MIPAFVEALRREGIDVSPAEAVDATRAVQHTGPEDRERFRTALRLTLVKRREKLATFDRVFDTFFATPARRSGRPRGERSTAGAGVRSGPRAGSGRAFETPPRPAHAPLGRSRPSAAKVVELASRSPVPPRPDTGRSASSSLRQRVGRLREAALRPEVSPRLPSRAGPSVPPPEHRDVTRPLPSSEELALAEAIPGIIDRLRLRASRRARRARRGRIWARRALRDNLSRGGVPFVLPRRAAKPRRTRVVLLVDVSFSTARAAGYFLWMAAAFLALGRRTRVIAFVDRPVDVTRAVAGWIRGRIDPKAARGGPKRLPGEGIRPAGVGFDALLRSIPRVDLSAPSDYGRAFHALLRSRMRPAGRDTVLVVLGDARTNRFEPLAWSLEEITRRCRYTAWLVPESRARWGTADSALGEYLPFVDTVVEAHDLSGLARGLDTLLRRV